MQFGYLEGIGAFISQMYYNFYFIFERRSFLVPLRMVMPLLCFAVLCCIPQSPLKRQGGRRSQSGYGECDDEDSHNNNYYYYST